MISDIRRYRLTYMLIAANVTLYMLSALYSGSITDISSRTLLSFGALNDGLVFSYGQWWRLIAAMFLHGGMTHLLMNMFSLYIVGRPMEIYFGYKSYLSIYFAAGIFGGLVSMAVHPHGISIGASGAIFGVFGALAGYFLEYRRELGPHARDFMKDFGLIIGINLLIGLSIPNVDMSAHIAGLISGMAGGFFAARHERRIWYFAAAMVLISSMLAFYLYAGFGAEQSAYYGSMPMGI